LLLPPPILFLMTSRKVLVLAAGFLDSSLDELGIETFLSSSSSPSLPLLPSLLLLLLLPTEPSLGSASPAL
jgi:hypothetical protein